MHGVKLPAALLADLYGDMLVIVPDGSASTSSTPSDAVAAMGSRTQLPEPLEPPQQPIESKLPKTNADLPPPAESILLGRYEKRVLVVVNEADYKHCSEDDLQFLQKILQALHLSMNDIGILNFARHPWHYGQVAKAFEPLHVLLLGIDAADIALPMRFPPFQVQPWGKTTFMQAPSLSAMNGQHAEQVAQKRKLWESLKRMFG